MSWTPEGSAFVIKSQTDFIGKILPKNFKHENFASFVRQLNMYGFHKEKSSQHKFFHEHFRRGRRYAPLRSHSPSDLLSEIKRKPTASRAHINDLTADPVASPLYEVVTELRRENQTLKERVHQLELQVNQLRMFKDHVRTNSQ